MAQGQSSPFPHPTPSARKPGRPWYPHYAPMIRELQEWGTRSVSWPDVVQTFVWYIMLFSFCVYFVDRATYYLCQMLWVFGSRLYFVIQFCLDSVQAQNMCVFSHKGSHEHAPGPICCKRWQKAKVIWQRLHQMRFAPFLRRGGSGPPSNTVFPGPPRVFTPNRTSFFV